MRRLFLLAALLFAPPGHAVSIDWVTVGDPGNACEVQPQGCFGSVADTYRISKYEVTNAQYAEFLNAVAATDTYALYNTSMGSGFGGITRSGSSGSYTYSPISGREDMPVNYVSWYDSLRFANWLRNGQPTGAQGSTTTEDGAYTFSGPTSVGARNAGATIFLTSEDEWYKAAYFDSALGGYFDYPAGTDAWTVCSVPTASANHANCANMVGDLVDVGSYTGSASPNGTFDQGGNVWEWNEAIAFSDPENRVARGGGFSSNTSSLPASVQASFLPGTEGRRYGFRVAMIPEPSTALLLATGLLAAARRRRH
jgi:formylglycine-generating enzyme required for sulfatase activity